MTHDAQADAWGCGVELIDYYRVIRRRWLLIVVPTLIVPIVAYVVAVGEPPKYVGDATMVVSEIRTSNPSQGQVPAFSPSVERDINTHMQAIRTMDVLEDADSRLSEPIGWRSIKGAVSLENPSGSNIITIQVRRGDPESASEIAEAVATAYADWTMERRGEALAMVCEQAEEELQATLDRLVEIPRETTVTVYSSESGQDIELASSPPSQLVGTNAYESLSYSLSQMNFSDIPYVGLAWVLESGVVNESPVGSNTKRDAVLGLAVGLFFGLGIAFLVEYIEKQRALDRT
ncbi:MAG: hypothetical protein PF636_08610 [Actinomycetota bacterium]|jgi:capsular polysaccharide biosynthesis protein|nr:hypothetical protein [Actinomycetota bacterium]